MAKVRIHLKTLPYHGRYGYYRPHSLLELEEDEARDLVLAGHAEYVSGEPVETASKEVEKPSGGIKLSENVTISPFVETASADPKPKPKGTLGRKAKRK